MRPVDIQGGDHLDDEGLEVEDEHPAELHGPRSRSELRG